MKKSLLTVLALGGFLSASAQLVEVAGVEKVALPEGVRVVQAVLSPDGSNAVITTGNGIAMLNLATAQALPISENGSISNLQFTADGSKVMFRESSVDANHRRFTAVKTFNAANGAVATVAEPSREVQGMGFTGADAVAVNAGKAKAKRLSDVEPQAVLPVLSINRGDLCVTAAGKTTVLNPLGDKANSYLWPSLSPDGKRICFYAVGCGAYTCNLDGSDLKSLGMLRAPRWLDNNIVVAMDDKDNGYVTVESAVIAVKADGSVNQRLTTAAQVALFPSAANGRIAFTDNEGALYIINLK